MAYLKIDIQKKFNRKGKSRWFYICSTTAYATPEAAVKGYLQSSRDNLNPERYKAVPNGSEDSRRGRDPQGYAA